MLAWAKFHWTALLSAFLLHSREGTFSLKRTDTDLRSNLWTGCSTWPELVRLD